MKKTRKKKGKGKMEGIVKKMWERGKKYKKKEGKNREFIFYLLVLAHTDHSRTLFWKKYDSFSMTIYFSANLLLFFFCYLGLG